MYFPVADIALSPVIPPLVAFGISFFTSMAGVSGAFLLLPFQVSILGFTSPAVSSTNHLFNIVAIPGGIYRFIKEGRMVWPLTWVVLLGTLPGVFSGVFIRVLYLPSPRNFKIFVGSVLLYIGIKLSFDILKRNQQSTRNKTKQQDHLTGFTVSNTKLNWRSLQYSFEGSVHTVNTLSLFCLSLIVGLIGGIYGIGGGAIISPFLVTIYRLPIHTVAGASLLATFITSATGVLFYQLLAFSSLAGMEKIAPDYRLGLLFGLGGAIGIYLGARMQRFFPAKTIKIILTAALFFTAVKYLFFN